MFTNRLYLHKIIKLEQERDEINREILVLEERRKELPYCILNIYLVSHLSDLVIIYSGDTYCFEHHMISPFEWCRKCIKKIQSVLICKQYKIITRSPLKIIFQDNHDQTIFDYLMATNDTAPFFSTMSIAGVWLPYSNMQFRIGTDSFSFIHVP